jgi:hypothetical protein
VCAETLHRQSGRIVVAGVAGCLLALNCAGFYANGADWWSSPGVLILLWLACTTANALLLPAGRLSLANIFLTLLFLFHMGYYLPIRLGLAHQLAYLPPVFGYAAGRGALVFCAALLSLELGYLFVAMQFRRAYVPSAIEPCTEWTHAARYAGWIITTLSFVSLLVFLTQTGGLAAALRFSYTSLFAFFHSSDPRFAFTAMWFGPLGLLLWRVGLTGTEEPGKSERWLWRLAAVLLLCPFLLIGARGPCFLFFTGCVYLRSTFERPWRLIQLAGVVLGLALAASLIASFRNLDSQERLRGVERWRVELLTPLLEIGSTYRPYYGILEMVDSGQQDLLHGESYWTAAKSLIPNVGSVERLAPSGYYRTSTWFNYRLSPRDDAAGVGIGCSIVAEQYANFGYFGVVGVFAATGVLIVVLESRAVVYGSSLARALLAILVIPLCWYIRDDVYGCVRMLVWPIVMLLVCRAVRLPFPRTCPSVERVAALPEGEA